MPPSHLLSAQALPDPVELFVEDAVLDSWVEDTSVYLRLDPVELTPLEAPPPDQF